MPLLLHKLREVWCLQYRCISTLVSVHEGAFNEHMETFPIGQAYDPYMSLEYV